MPLASVRGLPMYYELRGSGPPLLLVMGWRANLDWWPRALLAPLEARHRLILFDNRGAGRTGDPGGAFSIAQMADDAAALLEVLEVPRAHVFGVSMGGMIAQELALRHPSQVERLVLACTHAGGRRAMTPDRAMRRAWLRVLGTRWGLERRLSYLLFSKDVQSEQPELWRDFAEVVGRARISEWASAKQFLAIAGHASHRRIAEIRAPTLVVAGDGDLMVAPQNARWLASRIPGARLELVPGAGHALLHEHAPRIDGLLREFLG